MCTENRFIETKSSASPKHSNTNPFCVLEGLLLERIMSFANLNESVAFASFSCGRDARVP